MNGRIRGSTIITRVLMSYVMNAELDFMCTVRTVVLWIHHTIARTVWYPWCNRGSSRHHRQINKGCFCSFSIHSSSVPEWLVFIIKDNLYGGNITRGDLDFFVVDFVFCGILFDPLRDSRWTVVFLFVNIFFSFRINVSRIRTLQSETGVCKEY